MKSLFKLSLITISVFVYWSINAHDSIPGPKQSAPIVLKNGNIHTVSNGILPDSDLLFENGKITAIGSDLKLPRNTRVIDLQGKRVYPGLISSNSILGLVEISAVRATRDFAESGTVNPNVHSATAINPDSELIPVTRANGVLIAHVLPQGGLISGSSAIISLEGWTIEEMALERQAGIHIRWPRSPSAPGFHPDASSIYNAGKAEDKYQENLRKLDTIIEDARSFQKALDSAGDDLDVNLRDESLLPLLKKEIPAYITVSKVREIRDAVNWAVNKDLKIVIIAGNDAWRAADILKQHDIGIIIRHVNSLPSRRWESYDTAFANAAKLHEKGVRFAIAYGGGGATGSNERNLPYEAAKSAAHGLPKAEALKAITLYPAQLLGIDDRVGSLEVGKLATLFITDGDPLDLRTQVLEAFIDGRQVDLSNRHTQLHEKYQEKYK